LGVEGHEKLPPRVLVLVEARLESPDEPTMRRTSRWRRGSAALIRSLPPPVDVATPTPATGRLLLAPLDGTAAATA
jgi:hypothetical protein